MILRLTAPGKLMIAGEYVVLDGAESLVAAVGARVIALASPLGSDGSPGSSPVSPGGAGLPPEAVLARSYAEAELGAAPMELTIDTSALRHGDKKLGLGSSAAASAASAAAVLAWHGGDPAAERRRVLGWALAGHRAVAPQGSGADVAASTLGGLVRFRRDAVEEASSIAWPSTLHVVVVWTGEPARTSDLVAKVRALADADRPRYEQATAPLARAAEALLAAMIEGDAHGAVRAAGEHGRAMAGLGHAAGAPIMTPLLARVAALAEAHGGGAKPSGAGGGDVALAFFDDEDRAEAFRGACRLEGLALVPLAIGVEGVRVDAPAEEHSGSREG